MITIILILLNIIIILLYLHGIAITVNVDRFTYYINVYNKLITKTGTFVVNNILYTYYIVKIKGYTKQLNLFIFKIGYGKSYTVKEISFKSDSFLICNLSHNRKVILNLEDNISNKIDNSDIIYIFTTTDSRLSLFKSMLLSNNFLTIDDKYYFRNKECVKLYPILQIF